MSEIKRLKERLVKVTVLDQKIEISRDNSADDNKILVDRVVWNLEEGYNITHRPKKYVEKKVDESMLHLWENKVEKMEVKELDLIFTEMQQKLDKDKKVVIQVPITPLKVVNQHGEENEYFIMSYKQLKDVQFLDK